jgi:hypothetical protein
VRFKCFKRDEESWKILRKLTTIECGDFDPKYEESFEVVWIGQTVDKKITELVPNEWMRNTFRKWYIEAVRHRQKWCKVTPGKRRKLVRNVDEDSAWKSPPVVMKRLAYCYKRPDEDACLFKSMASCLHYMGHKQKARRIYNAINKSLHCMDRFELLTSLMKEDGRLCSVPVIYKEGKFDPFIRQSKYPTACQLVAKDGGIEHAVTFYKNLVFDAAEEKPMEISKESLKKCTGTGFLRSMYAVQYLHGQVENFHN